MIALIGLGAQKGDLTERGKTEIFSADRVIVRTGKGTAAEILSALGVKFETLDGAFPRTRSFDSWYKKAAAFVLKAGKTGKVAYCTAGAVGEDRCALSVAARCKNAVIVGGVSKAERALELCRLPSTSFARVSAYELHETENLTLPAVVYDLDDELSAGDVKLILSDRIGEETRIFFVRGGKAKKIRVYELDRQREYDETAAVVVPALPLLEKNRFDIHDLENIIRRLRRPDGCPWDKVQTPESIRMNAVEEAYELVDAIDSGEEGKILEEAGDILLQAVFQAVMAEERGAFSLADVTTAECEKLISRHTHIFGRDKASDEAGALSVWEKNKMKEKHQETFSDAVNDVPKVFPALLQAQKVAKRVEKGGWGFSSYEEAERKMAEELTELKAARASGDKKKIASELGDVLMCAVNLGREAGADCEEALLDTVNKIKRRFTAYEKAVLADGRDVNALSEAEKEEYYRAVKEAEEK